MPRQPRIESETGYYHIMIQGINKEKIFETEKEKEKIVTLIQEKTRGESIAVPDVFRCEKLNFSIDMQMGANGDGDFLHKKSLKSRMIDDMIYVKKR